MSDRQSTSAAVLDESVRRFLATPAASPGGSSLREMFRKLWRRKAVLIGTVILLTTLAALLTFQLTPVYTATASVMVEPRERKVVDIQAVVSGLPPDLFTIESEIAVLRSRSLIERVVSKLELAQNPEFNRELRPKRSLLKMLGLEGVLPTEVTDMLGSAAGKAKAEETPETKLERTRVELVDEFLRRLRTEMKGRSRVIEISFRSTEASLAAEAANTLADLYIVEQLEAKFEATRRATVWLNERLSGLREKVEASEKAVEDYRRRSGLTEGRGMTLSSQQLSELNSALIQARTQRAEAQARLAQVQNATRNPEGVEAVAEVLSNPLITRLREQEADLRRRVAELSQDIGERHPRMINLRAEMRDLNTKINAEVGKIVQQLRNEVRVAEAREASISAGLRQTETRAAEANRDEVQLRALQREATANRTLYETFLGRFKETSEQQEIQQPDARIISRADTPNRPSFPNPVMFVGVAFLLSIAAGLAFIVMLEKLDHGFRSMEQVEQLTGRPALGLIPLIPGLGPGKKAPHDYILEKPVSAFGESIRAIYAGLLLSNVDRPPRVVLVTSSLPGEGKTSLSIALARMIARTGQKRIVLVDCDLRRPQVHRNLKIPAKPGLVECLSGEATLEQVMQADKHTELTIIPSGGSPTTPSDLLSSEHFKRTVAQLAEKFDMVILDSSPVLAVSDSRILARIADKTVFIVRWAETRREVATMGIKQITDAGCDLAGVVLSMVNVRKHARYGYGDSGYYYGRYRKYYTS